MGVKVTRRAARISRGICRETMTNVVLPGPSARLAPATEAPFAVLGLEARHPTSKHTVRIAVQAVQVNDASRQHQHTRDFKCNPPNPNPIGNGGRDITHDRPTGP